MNKSQLKDILLQSIDEAIEAAIEAARTAQESAAHENNQPENQYDTLSLEAAYLAHGQSERILSLQEERITVARWKPLEYTEDDEIGTGAVVGLTNETGEMQWFWLALTGGWQVRVLDRNIRVISSDAPLARQMGGLGIDDHVLLAGQSWAVAQIG